MGRGDICKAPRIFASVVTPLFESGVCAREPLPVPRGRYPGGMCVCGSVCVLVSLDVSVWVSSLQRRLIRPWEYPMWQHIRTSLSCFWHPPLLITAHATPGLFMRRAPVSSAITRRTQWQRCDSASRATKKTKQQKKKNPKQKKRLLRVYICSCF